MKLNGRHRWNETMQAVEMCARFRFGTFPFRARILRRPKFVLVSREPTKLSQQETPIVIPQ